MICQIQGTVKAISEQTITILISNSGIGMELFMPIPNSLIIDQQIFLHTYLHWNQENGPTLFGFLTELEKKVFLLVISCSGIGPKIGLAVLSQMHPKEFIYAIHEQDIKALSSVNGIGAKKAEQIIMQLKHKIASFIDSGILKDMEGTSHISGISEVLNSLNYSRPEISNAMDYLRTNYGSKDYTFDQLLRNALSFLSKRV